LLITQGMAEVVAVFDPPLVLANGRVYIAQACGRQRDDRRWEGWLEFVPDDGSVVLRTERETTQRNLAELQHWAGTLTPVYLQGALDRTLTPPPVVAEPAEVPAVYDGPAPSRAVMHVTTTDVPVLDPFSVYAEHGESVLALRLADLTASELRVVIVSYDLADFADVDLDVMTVAELVGWIIGAVRGRLAA
jgi:hypothetical protein